MTGTAASPSRAAPDPAQDLHALARARFQASEEAAVLFFTAEDEAVCRVCHEMARRFAGGGRLMVYGTGAQASDAAHVAVEFTHPVVVGKRPLTAFALTSDAAEMIGLLGGRSDMLLILTLDDDAAGAAAALRQARERGMLTVALAGISGLPAGAADFVFAVPSDDAMVVQEIHETAYHILWELAHLFLEHRESA